MCFTLSIPCRSRDARLCSLHHPTPPLYAILLPTILHFTLPASRPARIQLHQRARCEHLASPTRPPTKPSTASSKALSTGRSLPFFLVDALNPLHGTTTSTIVVYDQFGSTKPTLLVLWRLQFTHGFGTTNLHVEERSDAGSPGKE